MRLVWNNIGVFMKDRELLKKSSRGLQPRVAEARGILRLLLISGLVLQIFACGVISNAGEEETPFQGNAVEPIVPIIPPPDGNGANNINSTQYCSPNENGQFSDGLQISKGSQDDFVWAEGGACVFRPIREVWAVSHNQPVMVWEGVDSSNATERADRPDGVSHFYEVYYFVDRIIDVNWTMNWYHSVRQGSFDAPSQVLINYKKIKGTRFIPYWEGSIILHQVTPDITSISMRNQIRASQTDEDDAASAISDVIQKLRTAPPNFGPLQPR